MMIVGLVSTKDEAEELKHVTKHFLIGSRARFLAKNL